MKHLKRKDTANRRAINVRIDEELYQDLAAVRRKADSLGLQFDTSEVCRDALRRAVKAAEKAIQRETDSQWTARDGELDLGDKSSG